MNPINSSHNLAISLIKQFEGCVLKPYLCPAHKWTIGWGSTQMPDGSIVTAKSSPITQQQADEMLAYMVSNISDKIMRLVKASLTEGQQASLIDFAYNLGVGRLTNSTLLIKLNKGDYQGTANEFPRWNLVNGKPMTGLIKRRAAEQHLFLKGTLS